MARGASGRCNHGSDRNISEGSSVCITCCRLYLFLEKPSQFHVKFFRYSLSGMASATEADLSGLASATGADLSDCFSLKEGILRLLVRTPCQDLHWSTKHLYQKVSMGLQLESQADLAVHFQREDH